MIIVTAKRFNTNNIVDGYVLYNTDKREQKIVSLATARKLLMSGVTIVNMRLSTNGIPEVGECNQGLTVLNHTNIPLSSVSWLITTVEKTGIVNLVSYTGDAYMCMWNDLIYIINQVANAWIVNGIIHGFFKSQYAYARGINYVSYYEHTY